MEKVLEGAYVNVFGKKDAIQGNLGVDTYVYINGKQAAAIQAFSFDEKLKKAVLIHLLIDLIGKPLLFNDGENVIEVYLKTEEMSKDEKKLIYKFTSPKRPYLSAGASVDDICLEQTWTFEDIEIEH